MSENERSSEAADSADLIEFELSRKLLEHGHINVPERALLGGRARFSVLVRVVNAALDEHPFFPARLRPDHVFSGVLFEKRGREYWIHERHEVGIAGISPVRSRRVKTVEAGLRRKLSDGHIDGLPIDFDA